MKRVFDRIVNVVTILSLVLCAIALVDFILHPLAGDHNFYSPIFRAISILLLVPLNLLVGFLIIRRVPGNVVGPLLIVYAGTVAYFSVRENIPPFLLAIYNGYDIVFGWAALMLMILHFPDGKIFPARASNWIYGYLGFQFVLTVLVVLSQRVIATPTRIANPLYLPTLYRLSGSFNSWSAIILIPILVMVLVSPAMRYRQGSVIERQQIKWLVLFSVFLAIYAILALTIIPILTGKEIMNPGTDIAGLIFYISAGLLPAVAIGVAVLRYRLWDIDIIIRRTVVYSTLTLSLTTIYVGSILALQAVSLALFGHQSTIATVLSTLVIAALFTPLRRGIQSAIDRRFYRKKYRAEQVLEDFSQSLRNEVNLDDLKASILEVVEGTMQPETISLWLMDSGNPKRNK